MTVLTGAVVLLVAAVIVFPLFLGLAATARQREIERHRQADAAYAEALQQYRAAQRIYTVMSQAREQMYAEARRHGVQADPSR
jgi:hypothetical protein